MHEIVCTAKMGVKGSYPVPPEAKHTPVLRSWSCKFGSKYGGTSSLIPNSSAKGWNRIINYNLVRSTSLNRTSF